MRVDHVAVRVPAALDGSADLVLAGPTAAKDALNLCQQVSGNLVATSLCQLLHKAGNEFAVAIGQEVQHALQVRADEDVHRRRDGREERAVTVVNAGGQEVGKHVVLVARHDELGDGQTHALGVVAGQDIAKVAGRYAELHGVAGLDGAGAQQLRIGGKVVDDLRYQAADVDGVGARKHRAGGLQALGKLLIGKDALDSTLGVVEVAADAAHGDVVALLRGHLQVLDAANLALGIKDGDARTRSVGKTGERSLAFGGNSRREHFPAKDACMDFINDIDGPESCNTNNMLKLTEDLHRRNPEARYADYYELATFNHILSTQHPEHGGYVYFTPARPRHYRNYSAPNEAMWGCVGTGMENHGKYGQFIYTHAGDALFVNLYAASQLDWKERGITLRQETAFPYSENSTITIAEGKGTFNLMVRYPGWVHPGEFKVSVNGKPADIITGPSSYVSINRKWKKGDVVNINFPMHSSLRYLPNEPQYVALMHGPILLGMKTGTESMASLIADDSRFGQYAGGPKQPIDKAPILINNDIASIPSQLTPVPGKPLHFTLSTRTENKIEGELQPFFEIHDSRYMIYWLALTEGSYKQYIDNIAKQEQERQALEASTVDKVQPGEQQPETDHQMETDESYTGNTNNVFYRDARNGHYFSYLMQTDGLTNLKLRLKYWGVGEWKSHEFDIYIDDVLLRSINNTGKYRISEFKAETYDIPATLLQDKKQVRVKFVAKPNKQIGEIYEVRLIKQ